MWQAETSPILKPGSGDGLPVEGEGWGCWSRDWGALSLPCGGAVPDAPAAGPGAQRHKAPLCG